MRELENLSDQLQKSGAIAVTQKIVVVHGLGGVSKTQLAVEYAWKYLDDYDAVLWLRADSPETLDASLAGLADVLGLPEASAKEQGVQIDAVLDWLKGHERWLLLADNADTDEAAKASQFRSFPRPAESVITSFISRKSHRKSTR